MNANYTHGLISILMPTYNVEKYVVQAVESILNQTYTQFELIIVDDASTDKTYDYLLELEKKDSRIKLYRNTKNLKIVKTLNLALEKANGEYISRMDGDDISLPERLEHLKRYLDEHTDCVLVGSQVDCIDEEGKLLSHARLLTTNKYIKKYSRIQSPVLHIWLARRCVYEKLEAYRECPYVEDYDFLLRGLNRGFIYANVDEVLYKVRMRNGNTATTNGLKQQKSKIVIIKLNRREKKIGRAIFDKNDFEKEIAITKKEENKYKKASEHLDVALRNRTHRVLMIKETAIACILSKYIFYKVYSSMMIRIGTYMERMSRNP